MQWQEFMPFSSGDKIYVPEDFTQQTIEVIYHMLCLIYDTLYIKTNLLIKYWLRTFICCTIWDAEKKEFQFHVEQ